MSEPAPPSSTRATPRALVWALALLPLLLLGVLLAVIVRTRPVDALRGDAPPVEVLDFERVTLSGDGIRAELLNDGPDPVTIAQVQVDDAYWAFEQHPPGPLDHLGRARVEIPYPWVNGETHVVKLVTSTGLTFDHTIDVAVASPEPGAKMLGVFALIGLYVGVIPVALGLLWYPLMKRLGRSGIDFVLALTLGLLLFLMVDAWHEGSEAVQDLPGSYQGMVLLVFSAIAAYLAIEGFGAFLRRRQRSVSASSDARADARSDAPWVVALLVAVGIGLHNLGEGLAIGAAFALGELALGTLLILGFTLHNTTEGLAIVAPLSHERTSLPRLILLGAVAGLPTILGAWLGGLVYSPVAAVLFLGIGVGAIAQVVVQIARSSVRGREPRQLLASAPVLTGLLAGVAIMYATGMLVG